MASLPPGFRDELDGFWFPVKIPIPQPLFKKIIFSVNNILSSFSISSNSTIQYNTLLHKSTYTLPVSHDPRKRLVLAPTHLWQRLSKLVCKSHPQELINPLSLFSLLYSPTRLRLYLTNEIGVGGGGYTAGLIRKYGLNMSRQAFREKAEEIGFKKVR